MNKLILAILLLISGQAFANVPNATPLFNQYNCNSATTQFPYAFQITTSTDMTVYLTDSSGNVTQLSTSVFSVDTTNLWVNYPLIGSPCATGSTITLRPSTPQTQTTTYGNRTPFTATAVGASFDKLTLISQQLQGQINRTFLQPANVTTQVTFPVSSPGFLIGWNGSGVLANINNPAAVAQWNLSGPNISYNTGNVSTTQNFTSATLNTTGNMGIGTTQSANALDIATGGVSIGTTYAGYQAAPSNGLIIQGNVGVGTWTTLNAQDVSGSEANGTYAGQKAAPANGLIVSGNTGIGTYLPSSLFEVGTQKFNVFSGGNVGIGSVNPGQVLDVTGSVRSSGGFLGPGVNVGIGTFSINLATASGTQVVSGLGFTPKVVSFTAAAGDNSFSRGEDNSTIHSSVYNSSSTSTFKFSPAFSIYYYSDSSDYYTGYVSALASGQFTVTWTKTGSPTGTFDVIYNASG